MSPSSSHWRVAIGLLVGASLTHHFAAAQTRPDESESLTAVITQIKGAVQYRQSSDQAWALASVNLQLNEGAELRTLPDSAVQFTIPPDQTIVLDRVSKLKIVRASFKDGKLVTDLGMEYGRTRFDIEGGGREHDARIRSQNSTLAVRGTRVALYDQAPFAPEAISFTGVARFQDPKKQLAFGSTRTTRVSAAADSAAALSLSNAVVDPASPQARSASETQLVQQLVSRGAQTFFDPNRGIRVVSGGQTPNIPSLAASLPGFTIVADWKSSTNFDLSVTRTSIIPSETIFPVKGLDRYPNGDHTPFDHRGGPSGGFEYANFPTADLNSAFDIGITNHGGAEGTATVRAFLNGRPQNVLNGDFVPLPSQTTTTLGVGAADVFSVNPSFSGLALPQSRTTARSAKPTPQHPASPEPRNPTNVSPRK